jgi:hypothetical protein
MKKHVFVLLLSTILFYQCSKLGIGGKASITVTVKDDTQKPVAGATVSYKDVSGISNTAGEVLLENLPKGDKRIVLQISANGYFKNSVAVNVDDECAYSTNAVLLQKPLLGVLTSGQGQVVGTGLKIIAGNNAFITKAGAAYSGDVKVYGRYINASEKDLLQSAMPGADFTATNSAGQQGMMVSYGFVATEYIADDGSELQPKRKWHYLLIFRQQYLPILKFGILMKMQDSGRTSKI